MIHEGVLALNKCCPIENHPRQSPSHCKRISLVTELSFISRAFQRRRHGRLQYRNSNTNEQLVFALVPVFQSMCATNSVFWSTAQRVGRSGDFRRCREHRQHQESSTIIDLKIHVHLHVENMRNSSTSRRLTQYGKFRCRASHRTETGNIFLKSSPKFLC